eukprot:s1861_g10.t1
MHGVCAYGSLTEIMPKHIAIPVSILSKLLLNSKILFARLAIHHVQWVQRPGLISHMLHQSCSDIGRAGAIRDGAEL